jgi:hypothetical protein
MFVVLLATAVITWSVCSLCIHRPRDPLEDALEHEENPYVLQ